MKDGRDETFEADAVDEYDQALDHEEAIVESAPEYLKTIEAESKDTDIVWLLRRQLPGWRSAGQKLGGTPAHDRGLSNRDFSAV